MKSPKTMTNIIIPSLWAQAITRNSTTALMKMKKSSNKRGISNPCHLEITTTESSSSSHITPKRIQTRAPCANSNRREERWIKMSNR